MFRRTRELIRALTAGNTGSDRRRHTRHATDVSTICRSVADGMAMTARIRNVSRTGVSVSIPGSHREGTMLEIDVPAGGDGHHTAVLACIMHVRQTGKGEWTAGCRFSLELTEAELAGFAGTAARGSADQRAWTRQPVQGTVEYRVLPGDDATPHTAEIVNLSPAGIGLIVAEDLHPGAAITLTVPRRDGKGDRQVLACAIYRTDRPDGRWAVGCSFLHELSEAEMDEIVAPND